MMTINLAPGAAMTAIARPVDYAERLERCPRRHRHLMRFVRMMVTDADDLLLSEKRAIISRVASLAGCRPEHVLMDIDTAAESKARVDDELALETITGLSGPDPFEGDGDDDRDF